MLVTALYKSEKVLFIKLNRSDSLLLLSGNQNSEGSSGTTATKYRPIDSSCENGILMA
jgi:hypothetical protein